MVLHLFTLNMLSVFIVSEPKTLESFSKKNQKTLPFNFADDILDNEMELEKEIVDLAAVQKLTELYTVIVIINR